MENKETLSIQMAVMESSEYLIACQYQTKILRRVMDTNDADVLSSMYLLFVTRWADFTEDAEEMSKTKGNNSEEFKHACGNALLYVMLAAQCADKMLSIFTWNDRIEP